MTPERKLQEVQKLLTSPGWTIIKEQMELEYRVASKKQNSPTPRPPEAYHFMRGVLHASELFLEVPEKLIMELKNTVFMEDAKERMKKDDKT